VRDLVNVAFKQHNFPQIFWFFAVFGVDFAKKGQVFAVNVRVYGCQNGRFYQNAHFCYVCE